jgi:hypothetical protein
MKKLILNKKIQILKKKKKNNLNSVHWNYQNIRLNIWFILYFSNTGFGILRTWHVLRGPTKSRLLQPPSARVQNPHLVAEKGKIVKLHKLAILLSQSQQGYSCTSTSQHNYIIKKPRERIFAYPEGIIPQLQVSRVGVRTFWRGKINGPMMMGWTWMTDTNLFQNLRKNLETSFSDFWRWW